jgi:transcriptional regulator with XRE-family HTH domain
MIAADEIRDIMSAAGLNQAGLAAKIGVTQPTVSRWLKGATPDPAQEDALRRLAEGVGRPRRPASLVDSFDPDEVDQEDHEPRMIEGAMGRDVGDLPKDAILQADVAIGMGPGGVTHVTDLMNADGNSYAAEGVKDWWRIPADVVRGRFRVPAHRVRCFEAIGDSMEPKIHDGDIVFVDVGHTVPSPPGIYALADALGGVILKRLEISSALGQDPVHVRLISENIKHSTEERTLDEIRITGRYLGRLTTE